MSRTLPRESSWRSWSAAASLTIRGYTEVLSRRCGSYLMALAMRDLTRPRHALARERMSVTGLPSRALPQAPFPTDQITTRACRPRTSISRRARGQRLVAELRARGVGQEDHVRSPLGRALEARGRVGRVADHRVLEPLLRADRAGHHGAGVEADADAEAVAVARLPDPRASIRASSSAGSVGSMNCTS